MKIAIIGAGLSGLTCAHSLQGKHEVSVFEKSRGVSGRLSTRYADPYQFDHGAQYFTARSDAFKNFLKSSLENGSVKLWEPKVVTLEKGKKPYKREWFEEHYVSAPKMNDLCKSLAKDLDVHVGVQIQKLERRGEQWILLDKDEQLYGPFDWVISSAPAPQTVDLFPENFEHHDKLQNIKMQGCFSLMLGFEEPLKLNWQAASVKHSSIGWMCVNSAKPSRETSFSLLVQSTNDWAEEFMDSDRAEIETLMLEELSALLEIDLHPDHVAFHSWRYAATAQSAGQDCLIDNVHHLAACGDWCLEGHVESAFLSGLAVAQSFA